MLDLNQPHHRINILTGEKVLVSPHRNNRPWQGKVEDLLPEARLAYDPHCYLCPGNVRADGSQNPDYKDTYIFTNDFSAILEDTREGELNNANLLQASSERGICKVITFSPRHDLTLPEMEIPDIRKVIDLWQKEFEALAQHEWIKYIQIFENKGSVMGCSNPHPHGQIWSQSSLPNEILIETAKQKEYYEQNGVSLLKDYLELELRLQERIVINNEHFVALVPFWATWPFETLVISKRHCQTISDFSDAEKEDLARTIQELTIRYDNIFNTSFPYSAGMHQSPVNDGNHQEWHWHIHFYPPLLRSATIKKFMVGYEMLGSPQRDITAESAAETLLKQSTIHYKKAQK